MKKILIADDDPKNLARMTEAFGSYDDVEVITAGRASPAAQILTLIKVDMVIADVESPEVNGLKFLSFVRKKYPGLPVAAMGSSAYAKIRPKLDAVGVSRYFHKTTDLDFLVTTLAGELNIGSEGRIHGISLPSFLQLVNMEEKTCTLKIQSGSKIGYIFCDDGELIAAEAGGLRGKDALFEIMFWEQTGILLEEGCKVREIEITEPLTYLLMESHRVRDEEDAKNDRGQFEFRIRMPEASDSVPPEISELIGLLKKNRDVHEYAIFDNRDRMENHDSQSGLLAKAVPSPYFEAASEINAYLQAGISKYMVFSTRKGIRYLMFDHKGRRISVALKPGIRPADFMKEVRREP